MTRLTPWFILLACFIGYSSFFIVEETEPAIVTRFGEYRWTAHDAGMYFKKPFLNDVYMMDSRINTSDTLKSDYLALDKKRLVADPITRWRIVEPLLFYKTVHDEVRARERLDDIVRGEMRREIASHTFGKIIGGARGPLMREVGQRVRKKAVEYGIHVVDVRIKRADLPDAAEDSVFQRMRAERDRMAKRYQSEGAEEAAVIRAKTDKEVTILLAEAYQKAETIKGDGDKESTRVYAKAFERDPDFYGFLRSLEAYEKSIDTTTHMVFSTGSDFFANLSNRKAK